MALVQPLLLQHDEQIVNGATNALVKAAADNFLSQELGLMMKDEVREQSVQSTSRGQL